MDWNYQESVFSHYGQPPDLHMHVYGRPMHIQTANVDYSAYRPIDAVPQMMTHRTGTLEDFVHFAPSLARTQEIIVPEDSVDELLSRILTMQQPGRIERIKRDLRNREVRDPWRDFAGRLD
jgi:hypothetical protein